MASRAIKLLSLITFPLLAIGLIALSIAGCQRSSAVHTGRKIASPVSSERRTPSKYERKDGLPHYENWGDKYSSIDAVKGKLAFDLMLPTSTKGRKFEAFYVEKRAPLQDRSIKATYTGGLVFAAYPEPSTEKEQLEHFKQVVNQPKNRLSNLIKIHGNPGCGSNPNITEGPFGKHQNPGSLAWWEGGVMYSLIGPGIKLHELIEIAESTKHQTQPFSSRFDTYPLVIRSAESDVQQEIEQVSVKVESVAEAQELLGYDVPFTAKANGRKLIGIYVEDSQILYLRYQDDIYVTYHAETGSMSSNLTVRGYKGHGADSADGSSLAWYENGRSILIVCPKGVRLPELLTIAKSMRWQVTENRPAKNKPQDFIIRMQPSAK